MLITPFIPVLEAWLPQLRIKGTVVHERLVAEYGVVADDRRYIGAAGTSAPGSINRRLQYDFNIGRMLISVTSAVLGSASAATTIVAMSSGCSGSSGL